MNEFDKLADDLVEKRYQLRVEHNHGNMKWYAYYAGKGQRKLFDEYQDWETESATPTEALGKLKEIGIKIELSEDLVAVIREGSRRAKGLS